MGANIQAHITAIKIVFKDSLHHSPGTIAYLEQNIHCKYDCVEISC